MLFCHPSRRADSLLLCVQFAAVFVLQVHNYDWFENLSNFKGGATAWRKQEDGNTETPNEGQPTANLAEVIPWDVRLGSSKCNECSFATRFHMLLKSPKMDSRVFQCRTYVFLKGYFTLVSPRIFSLVVKARTPPPRSVTGTQHGLLSGGTPTHPSEG